MKVYTFINITDLQAWLTGKDPTKVISAYFDAVSGYHVVIYNG